MPTETVQSGKAYRGYIRGQKLFLLGLALATVAIFVLSIAFGSSTLPIGRVLAALAGRAEGKKKYPADGLSDEVALFESVDHAVGGKERRN